MCKSITDIIIRIIEIINQFAAREFNDISIHEFQNS